VEIQVPPAVAPKLLVVLSLSQSCMMVVAVVAAMWVSNATEKAAVVKEWMRNGVLFWFMGFWNLGVWF
jgi:hypothetical protein